MDGVPVQDQAVVVHHARARNDPGVMHDPLMGDHTGAFDDLARRQPARPGRAFAPVVPRVGCGWRSDEYERERAQQRKSYEHQVYLAIAAQTAS
jgi:hypothetical protein